MILKVALVLLYLVIGLWLFTAAITALGGRKEAGYDNPVIFVIGLVTVTIAWPYFLVMGIFGRKE